jgi:ketosteroid isomerase-like protein
MLARTTIQAPMCALHERHRFRFKTFFSALPLLLFGCVFLPASSCLGMLLRVTPPLLHREDKLHKEIEGLEAQWRQAILTNNVGALDHLLADDYLGITANGTLETKADAIALRRAGTIKISELQPKDTKIHVYGDTAVVTSRVDLTGTSGDRDISGVYHYTRVYNRRDGQWKVVSFEASRMPDKGRH